ncbi:cupin domain-containing protein [Paraglaciecola arctica]|uniref:cupin domain-containing protein n=1 Tax=Paraglaciecola arctica TaxID=1128911 RepID=UPI001C066828|nr:cupin domain-containing protein [Paraglaciecola arctica]MBU3005745.1 cupin domain-containing protein [Paraglaciecola arctica]
MPKFECDFPDDEIIDPTKIKDIVCCKSYRGGNWKGEGKHKLFNEPEIRKYFIPVNSTYWNLDIITEVDPGTIIPKHKHDEPVLRYVMDGEMELNGVTYVPGDWVIVPANVPYQIQTRLGYRILSRYSENCKECNWKTISKMPLDKMAP